VNPNELYCSQSPTLSILSEPMFIITSEMAVLPSNRRLDNVDEEVGTSSEDPQQFQPQSYSVPANSPSLGNHIADNPASSNPLTNSHRPSGSGIGMRAETVGNHNSAASNLRGEAPPPYVEVVGQREVDHR
jgi:hypothetical protein